MTNQRNDSRTNERNDRSDRKADERDERSTSRQDDRQDSRQTQQSQSHSKQAQSHSDSKEAQKVPYGTKLTPGADPNNSQIEQQFGGQQPTKLDGTPDRRFEGNNGQGRVSDPEHDMRLAENKTPDKINSEVGRRTGQGS
jgi:hypothetical protein